MNIIPISQTIINNEETNSVNARDLHRNLGIKKKFADWIKTQISSLYLEENRDYILISPKRETMQGRGGDRKSVEYIITTDTAKGIAMATRTPKGNEVRKYFIEVEKQFKEIAEPTPHTLSHKEVIKNLARAEIKRLEEVIAECEATIKVSKAEKSHYSKLFHSTMIGVSKKEYTKADEQLIIELGNQGKSSKAIGEALGRSANAIRNKIGKMKRTGAWRC